ncbi:putative isoamyl alcohol oxidase [Leptodontidium sp. MPI-SDFR-AT-0119]|nr:putative isoamyl alcohol oxidase [Leptodontidium sp. MPI-SDFR-AT-0119]
MRYTAVVAALASVQSFVSVGASRCHCLPGETCWPAASQWSALNATVDGRLLATVPIGTPCHDPNYNEIACAALQSNWTLPQLHLASSSSVMQTYFANQSCDPFTPQSQACVLGNYVSYAVNVSCTSDVVAALSFAHKNNIRIVIRNTGHDYFGRSTGAGSLSIWTHHLKDIEFLNYSSSAYTGPAAKVGAGIIGAEALAAAHANNYVIVTGECPTVGIAGGYTQGGGHSALSTTFGLGADQTLEFQVVTALGKVVTASASQNSDLYWALSGGGGGTYGVVISMTVKVYPEATVGGASLQMAAASTTQEKFDQAVSQFHAMLPNMTDHGAMVIYYLNNAVFVINPITVYNSTAAYVRDTILGPFMAVLADLGIPSSVAYTELSYYDHYSTYMGPLPYGNIGVGEYQYGSRLIPRSVLENDNAALQAALRNLTAHGVLAVGSSASYTKPAGVNNSVLPAWRETTVHIQLGTPWNETAPWADMVAAQIQMTNEFVAQVEAVTPGSGAYINEADFRQPNWQETFFGANYATLLAIKRHWDPDSMFYGLRTVGSDTWTVANDGRMCTST